jgi:hypothetical protein
VERGIGRVSDLPPEIPNVTIRNFLPRLLHPTAATLTLERSVCQARAATATTMGEARHLSQRHDVSPDQLIFHGPD